MKTMTQISALALSAALAFAAPAMAQTAAPQLSAAHIEAGKELAVVSGISRTFGAFVPAMAQQIFNMVTPTRPELRKDLEEVLKGLIPEFDKRTSVVLEETGKLFAGSMPEADIRAALAFFKSPAGMRYVEMQPKVIDQMVVALDDWNRKLTEEFLARARAEMKKRGKDM